MSTNIKLKRSSVQGKVPLTTDLELGELAINTYDGKLYMKKNDGTDSIVDITAGGSAPNLDLVTTAGSTTNNSITVGGLIVDTDTFIIDSVNNRIGIGISNPLTSLHVDATGYNISGNTYITSAFLQDGSTYRGVYLGYESNEQRGWILGAGLSSSLSIGTFNSSAPVEAIRIDASGNVGIGTTAPEYKLDVAGDIAIDNGGAIVGKNTTGGDTQLLYWGAASGVVYYGRNTPGGSVTQHEFRTAGNTRLTIDNSGNVGIGTTSPGTPLDVNGTARATQFRLASTGVLDDATATTTATTQVAIDQWSATAYGGGKVIIEAKTGVNRHIVELLVTHDGTTAIATEYGAVYTSGALATYDVDISGGNVRILATPASSTSTSFKIMRTTMFA